MLYTILCYIKYFFVSKRTNLGLSPFLKDFRKQVLKKNLDSNFKFKIDNLKEYYLRNETQIAIEDYGAGSLTNKEELHLYSIQLLKDIAIKDNYGKILTNLISFLNIEKSLELGTSLGIGSAYLSGSKVLTIEGNKELSEFTRKSLAKNGFHNITIVNNQFDLIFEEKLKHQFDLLFIDGNHTYEATIKYFEIFKKHKKRNSVIVFDDIYWSKGMTKAWNEIKASKEMKLSIDLFNFGIVIFNEKVTEKEEVVLWY